MAERLLLNQLLAGSIPVAGSMGYYELVNMSTSNRAGEYDTLEEALDDVDQTTRRFGLSAIESVALIYNDDDGDAVIIVEGRDLARYHILMT